MGTVEEMPYLSTRDKDSRRNTAGGNTACINISYTDEALKILFVNGTAQYLWNTNNKSKKYFRIGEY